MTKMMLQVSRRKVELEAQGPEWRNPSGSDVPVPMRIRACSAILLFFSACATTEPCASAQVADSPRIANLRRAATYPWLDEGRCAVQESSQSWDELIRRCYDSLDHGRIRYQDEERICPVASTGAVAVPAMVAVCLLAQPVAVGAVIIIGTVVVASAIKEELEAYERRASRERPKPEANREPKREPAPEKSTEPFIPPIPTSEEREDWSRRCRDHYVQCKHSPEGERWGRKFSESQCQACWDLCRRTGQWPDEANGKPCPGGG